MSQYVTKINPNFVSQYANKIPPWGPIGYIVYKRTYARPMAGKGRTEEWFETVHRCCDGLLSIGGKFTQQEIENLYDKVFNLKCCFSGRALWQLGTTTVNKLGGDSLMNCWGTAVNDPIKIFCFAFDELMLGGGVGFNIQREFVYEMPKVKYAVNVVRRDEKDVDFVVPDNREGWVELLRRVLQAFYITGKSFHYSTICVRGKGVPIKSFGGTASGPEDLCNGIEEICNIITSRVGKKLRPIDCLDIMNIIGSIVIAGNVRRSAQIALGDMDDWQYLDAKNWGKGDVPNWRAMSNNSVICNDFEHLPSRFWNGYNGDGEAYGLVNLKNCQTYGRMKDGKGYRPDKDVVSVNPCGELPLSNMESCNLSEIFLPNLKDEAEFKEVAGLCCMVVKTIACLKFSHEETQLIAGKNFRLGIGVTGFLQKHGLRDEQIFDNVYHHIEEVDKKYSEVLGVKTSIKLTTCKPSGTLSLLPNVTPGVHPAYAPYYIRRVQMASSDPLITKCRQNGYNIEPVVNLDGSYNRNTMVVSFPMKAPDGAICAKDVTAVQQMEWATWMQRNWSDNSVSVTVYYKKEELPEIQAWLTQNYDKYVKTMSFLLHKDHGFAQAPYEEISEERYIELAKNVIPITSLGQDMGVHDLQGSLECSQGTCPIK